MTDYAAWDRALDKILSLPEHERAVALAELKLKGLGGMSKQVVRRETRSNDERSR